MTKMFYFSLNSHLKCYILILTLGNFFSILQISVSVSLADGFQVGMLVVKCPDRRSIKTLPLSFQFRIEVDYLGRVAAKPVFGGFRQSEIHTSLPSYMD